MIDYHKHPLFVNKYYYVNITFLFDKVQCRECAKCLISQNIENIKMCTYCVFTFWGRHNIAVVNPDFFNKVDLLMP